MNIEKIEKDVDKFMDKMFECYPTLMDARRWSDNYLKEQIDKKQEELHGQAS